MAQSLGLAAVGVLIGGIGALGWSGRLVRGSPRNSFTAYTVTSSIGIGLLLLAVFGLPPLRESPLGLLLFGLPAFAFMIFGIYCALAGPPVWAVPEWQRPYYDRARRQGR
ncbi:MAG: hypothetical protein ABIV94_08845 [Acidimicrobiales bacterium]